jgi:HEPN superfamily RiboL-PSP-like protein
MSHEPLSNWTQVEQFLDDLVHRFNGNISRAIALVRHSQQLAEHEDVASDILRSAVVFVHATLEDLLRSVASVLLPYCDEETLRNIPLVGTNGRAEKFSLGKLAAHREKSILDVIRESVEERLLKSTYNDTDDIADLLKGLGIQIENEDSNRLYPQLASLMARRHQIVHRADKKQQDELDSITAAQVEEWIDVVGDFMTTTTKQIASDWLDRSENPRH